MDVGPYAYDYQDYLEKQKRQYEDKTNLIAFSSHCSFCRLLTR